MSQSAFRSAISLALAMLLIPTLSAAGSGVGSPSSQAPPWARDLVIYEIATKAFTSPNGPESGTFASLQAKLPYLQNLGITGIWLSGHSLSDPKHFLNIWTQYACIEPDKLDPSLGTPEQFKAMIDDAHNRGIKIFLDVITHGVMKESALVRNHPGWFLGEGWGGMREYDWLGGHTDLDNRWVQIWTDYVTRYGIDGFRLDLGTTRPDIWARIRQNAYASGHPIVIFEEAFTATPGVTDFGQANNWISNGKVGNEIALNDVPGFYRIKFGQAGRYNAQILYGDGTSATGESGKQGALSAHVDGLLVDKTSKRPGFYGVYAPDGVADVQLTIDGVATYRSLKHISITSEDIQAPMSSERQSWEADIELSAVDGTYWAVPNPISSPLALSGRAPAIQVHIPTLTHGNAIMLSCHDNGQVGFPEDKSAYSAQGSRATFGYSFLFTPMIPIFMSGEEFDANFHALPRLSSEFFGGKHPGKGKWLYGSMLDWSEPAQSHHRSMLEDVKRMLMIRKQESDLLRPLLQGDVEPQLVAVPHASSIAVPVPYIRWNQNTAIVILANRNTEADAHLKLQIPLQKLGWKTDARYKVTDLWKGGGATVYSGTALSGLAYTVKKDKSSGGGVGLMKIDLNLSP
jgi:hypothetical protein